MHWHATAKALRYSKPSVKRGEILQNYKFELLIYPQLKMALVLKKKSQGCAQ